MKQVLSVTNSSNDRLAVILEPIAEARTLEKGERLQITIDFAKETTSPQDIVELNYSDKTITIFYTAAAVADWAAR